MAFRVDAGQVEAGDFQQAFQLVAHGPGGHLDALEHRLLLRRQVRLAQVGKEHAQGVQGLAQIVAGGGEEAGLGPVGPLRVAAAGLDLTGGLAHPLGQVVPVAGQFHGQRPQADELAADEQAGDEQGDGRHPHQGHHLDLAGAPLAQGALGSAHGDDAQVVVARHFHLGEQVALAAQGLGQRAGVAEIPVGHHLAEVAAQVFVLILGILAAQGHQDAGAVDQGGLE